MGKADSKSTTPKNRSICLPLRKMSIEKVYVATTVGKECILSAEIAKDAGEEALTGAYKVFKDECQCLKPTYSPETVNTDGWKSSHNAWSFLFTSVCIICCFLHVFIKIRYRGKKKYKDLFIQVSSKLWECYSAVNKASFTQRVGRPHEWCEKNEIPDVFLKPIQKLRKNIADYRAAYSKASFPSLYRKLLHCCMRTTM